jgi:hypothetical protein
MGAKHESNVFSRAPYRVVDEFAATIRRISVTTLLTISTPPPGRCAGAIGASGVRRSGSSSSPFATTLIDTAVAARVDPARTPGRQHPAAAGGLNDAAAGSVERLPVAKATPEQVLQAGAAGFEPGGDGYFVGRDPREMTPAELAAIGHEQMSPMAAIRAKCLDCCAGSPHEVRLCVVITCANWPFLTGKNSWRVPPLEAQREAARRSAAKLHGKSSEAGGMPGFGDDYGPDESA